MANLNLVVPEEICPQDYQSIITRIESALENSELPLGLLNTPPELPHLYEMVRQAFEGDPRINFTYDKERSELWLVKPNTRKWRRPRYDY